MIKRFVFVSVQKRRALKPYIASYFFLLLAPCFQSPAVSRRVRAARAADTAEWCCAQSRPVIFLTNGLRVASYSLEAAFT